MLSLLDTVASELDRATNLLYKPASSWLQLAYADHRN